MGHETYNTTCFPQPVDGGDELPIGTFHSGRCGVCGGSGVCRACGGHWSSKNCKVCRAGKCPRCKGSGQDPA